MINFWAAGINAMPTLLPFVTLRQERFGAILFNPYLGIEVELDPLETYIASLCNGQNSCRQVEDAFQERFRLSQAEKDGYISKTAEKLANAFSFTFNKGIENEMPILPKIMTFSEDDPYLSAPRNAIWDVTYACNLSCPHCLTSSGKIHKDELRTQQALFLIDKLAEAKILTLSLSGGEPFMRPDILQLLRYISRTNMRVDIATNGVMLDENILMGLKELPVFQVQVSIDGMNDAHDRFRGRKGAFDAACHTIQRLTEEQIAVSISTTATSENLGSIDQIIDLAVDLGCSNFKAISFMPAGRGKKNADRLKLGREEYFALCRILIERSQELRGVLNISTDTCLSFLLQPPPTEMYQNGPMGCSAGYDTLSIGADGTAYPCPFLHEIPLGNLMDLPLHYIWNKSPTMNVLRSLQKQDMEEPCKNCKYAPLLCKGGCRASAYLECGNLNGADAICSKRESNGLYHAA